MSKSKCIQRCYRKASHNQKTLDCFFSVSGIHSESVTIRQGSNEVEIPPVTHEENINETMPAICEESVDIEIPPAIQEEIVDVEIPLVIREESVEVIIPELTRDEYNENG